MKIKKSKKDKIKKFGGFVLIYGVFLWVCTLDCSGVFQSKKEKEKIRPIFKIDSTSIETYKNMYRMFRDTMKKVKEESYENKNK